MDVGIYYTIGNHRTGARWDHRTDDPRDVEMRIWIDPVMRVRRVCVPADSTHDMVRGHTAGLNWWSDRHIGPLA
jgi:hypothetical protein